MSRLLSITGLSVVLARRQVLDQVSLNLAAGEVVGLIGRNGAGKSTTLRAAMGLLPAGCGVTQEAVRWDVQRDRVGVAFDRPCLLEAGSAPANLRLLATYLSVGVDAEALLDEVGLNERMRKTPMRHLSHGSRQKAALAAALLGSPAVLILDEPHNGLDPVAVRELGRVLRARAERGTGVLVSSHLVDELGRVCDRVVVLDEGRVVLDTPTGLRAHEQEWLLEVDDPVAAAGIVQANGSSCRHDGPELHLQGQDREDVARAIGLLVEHGIRVFRAEPVSQSVTQRVEQALVGAGHA